MEAGLGAGRPLETVATMCGDQAELREPVLVIRRVSRLRVRFVSGAVASLRGRGFRGFSFTVTALLPAEGGTRGGVVAAYTVSVVMFVLMVVAGAVIAARRRRAAGPRSGGRRVTWHGSAPRPGTSLHEDRCFKHNSLIFS